MSPALRLAVLPGLIVTHFCATTLPTATPTLPKTTPPALFPPTVRALSAQVIAQEFFDCCETGKGWEGCSQLVVENAPFNVQAVDALNGPKVTDNKNVKDYLDWMAGFVKMFGAKATYTVKAKSFDSATNTALYYAVFMGYSDYVYAIRIDPEQMRVSAMSKVWNDQYAFDHMPVTETPHDIAQIFFECCTTGLGWAGCSHFVTEDSSFNFQSTDTATNKWSNIENYLNWMADIVKEHGANAKNSVKAKSFDNASNTAFYYGSFMGYSDYVYVIHVDPQQMKVNEMTKVWNSEYAVSHSGDVVQRPKHLQQASAGFAQYFVDCCEKGKGWKGCSQFVTDASAKFHVQAVDASARPEYVKDYLNWMGGVVEGLGEEATYTVKAQGFDSASNTAMYYVEFMGYSDHVYMINMDSKVSSITKVWNDQYFKDHFPGSNAHWYGNIFFLAVLVGTLAALGAFMKVFRPRSCWPMALLSSARQVLLAGGVNVEELEGAQRPGEGASTQEELRRMRLQRLDTPQAAEAELEELETLEAIHDAE